MSRLESASGSGESHVKVEYRIGELSWFWRGGEGNVGGKVS